MICMQISIVESKGLCMDSPSRFLSNRHILANTLNQLMRGGCKYCGWMNLGRGIVLLKCVGPKSIEQ